MKEESTTNVYELELRVVKELARVAGQAALSYYGTKLHVEHKADADEPVTEADYAANDIIVRGLSEAFPDDGLLSEESIDTERRLTKRRVWIIDPLDGTSGFIARNGDFAVQIGLAVEGECALGVVYQPAFNVLQWAARGAGAWMISEDEGEPKRLRASDEVDFAHLRLAASRSHRSPRMDKLVQTLGLASEVRRGSVGVKVGLIATQHCDLYIHLSPRTRQWDTCAPEAIIREAGGEFTDLFGVPYRYNTPDIQNHNGLIATNGASHSAVAKRLAPLLREFGRARV